MPLETSTFITGLDNTWPLSSDPVSSGDDHLRLIKSVLQATFPNANAAMTATPGEMNYVGGVTSSIQDQFDAITSATGSIPSGTVMLFYQAIAPVGWTAVAGITDSALRVVPSASSGGASSGSAGFATAFDGHVHATSGHALTVAEMPNHKHNITVHSGVDNDATPQFVSGRQTSGGGSTSNTLTTAISTEGGGGSHTHGDTAGNAAFNFKYSDVIIATKD